MNTLVLARRQRTVGSSVAATMIASYLANQGQRVLAIDLDPAGNFARAFRCRAEVALISQAIEHSLTGIARQMYPDGLRA